jgi:pimeloyl-ACP methyl ester carboxylesterase
MREGGHKEQGPEDWPTLVAKVMKLGLEFKDWRPENIRSIKAPVLVMIGDADVVGVEHAMEMFRLLRTSERH